MGDILGVKGASKAARRQQKKALRQSRRESEEFRKRSAGIAGELSASRREQEAALEALQERLAVKPRRLPTERDRDIREIARRRRAQGVRRGRTSTILTDQLQSSTGTNYSRTLGGA